MTKDHYFRTLGIGNDRKKLRAALNRAYQLRSFEIEHYWKRATYFWGFQVAIFAAFGLIWEKSTSSNWNPITLALAGLGVLTALANVLSARGSKFWQENWEKHIDMLEDEIEGRLHKTVWMSNKSASFSVSRINQLLSMYFVVFWFTVFSYVCWSLLDCTYALLASGTARYVCVLLASSIVVLGICCLGGERSNLQGIIPNADGSHVEQSDIKNKDLPFFLRRFSPDEERNH